MDDPIPDTNLFPTPNHPLLQRVLEDGTTTTFPPTALVFVSMISQEYAIAMSPMLLLSKSSKELNRTGAPLSSPSTHLDLTTMPEDMFKLLLPILLHIITDKPSTTDFHDLHVFVEEVPRLAVMAWQWLRDGSGARYLNMHFKASQLYPDFKTAYNNAEQIRLNRRASNMTGTNQKTYLYNFISKCHCTGCIAMATQLNVIGYDMYGKSALHAAIEAVPLFPGSEGGLVLWLLDEILNTGVNPRHMPTSIEEMSIPHHVARMKDPQVFMAMVKKFSSKGFPILLWNDDGLKLQLCSFASRYMAEWLWRYEKFNIAYLPRNTLPYRLPPQGGPIYDTLPLHYLWNRDAEYGDPIDHSFFDGVPNRADFAIAYVNDPDIHPRFGERPTVRNDTNDDDSDSEEEEEYYPNRSPSPQRTPSQNRSDPPNWSSNEEHFNDRRPDTSRTIWHRAIENPNGSDILRWFNEHSDVSPRTRNNFNRRNHPESITPLRAAVRGNQPATKWFCDQYGFGKLTHTDAALYAALNMNANCVQILDIVLSRLDREAWRDTEGVKRIYWWIIIAYNRAHMESTTELPRGSERETRTSRLIEATKEKLRVLNQKLRPFWDTFQESVQIHWLLRFVELQEETWIRQGVLQLEIERSFTDDFEQGAGFWRASYDHGPVTDR
ncbi:uncharacterized protein N7446_003072 [Penicillium canescens]|uniref:Uncharacterized protein n=1 Tax=Penicillium canescens TaxID=5083 RepID=A0AAD6NA13_PENCN|nr:uncharacterized protein N7446_003072 [Penicillium canescens]KAJ6044878.1 hypothetical protein N7460_006233 [Penicillium canescens]KAJ6056347.1 hypothetical protein N7444_005445 [Penicillium canescens]KAJ6075295.1 hypothetical protein N7446_003072 [Penicillium canescens]